LIRDWEAFGYWIIRDQPRFALGSVVGAWLDELDEASWAAPSVPTKSDNSVRTARLVEGTDDVTIVYKIEFGPLDLVDLVWVGEALPT